MSFCPWPISVDVKWAKHNWECLPSQLPNIVSISNCNLGNFCTTASIGVRPSRGLRIATWRTLFSILGQNNITIIPQTCVKFFFWDLSIIQSNYCILISCFESEVNRMGACGGGWCMVMILFNYVESPMQFILYGFQVECTIGKYCRVLSCFRLDQDNYGKALLGHICNVPYSACYYRRQVCAPRWRSIGKRESNI